MTEFGRKIVLSYYNKFHSRYLRYDLNIDGIYISADVQIDSIMI